MTCEWSAAALRAYLGGVTPRSVSSVVVVASTLTALWGCDRRPRAVVAIGAECTSPYDDQSVPRRVCPSGARCLLMMSKPGMTPEPYTCRLACRVDGDCASVGAGAKCEHANSHADDYGCIVR